MKIDDSDAQEYRNVLQKIHKLDRFRTTVLGPLDYDIASEIEKGVLLDLEDLGAIKLHNLTRSLLDRPSGIVHVVGIMPGEIKEEIKLDVLQPKFDDIYEKYLNNSTNKELTNSLPSGKVDKREVREFITKLKIKGKQKKFIQALADGKPKRLKDLGDITRSKGNIKSLKIEVVKKIKGSGFKIALEKSKSFNEPSCYRLEKLPQKE